MLLWIAYVLLLGGGGFLTGLLVGTPLVARGVRWWVLPLLGVVAFLAYNLVVVAVWQESDATGIVMFSPLQLLGWFAGTAVARRIVRLRPRAEQPTPWQEPR
jgi:predicted MFS family arabinose efflux permease